MKIRIIDEELALIPYFPNERIAYEWYQDRVLCKQVDNVDTPYSMEKLRAMYTYLTTHGECYYIRYHGIFVGDVSLKNDGEVAIVICKEYQNRGIGGRCIREVIRSAKEKGMHKVKAKIYSFNEQSKKMFVKVGFVQINEEEFIYPIK